MDNVKCSLPKEEAMCSYLDDQSTLVSRNSTNCCLKIHHSLESSTNTSDKVPSCLCKHDNMVDYHNNVSDRFILLPPNTDNKIICNHYTPCHPQHPEIIQNQLPNRNDFCEIHDCVEIKFYCQSCKVGICRDCVRFDHRSRDFVYYKERPETKACDQQRIIRI